MSADQIYAKVIADSWSDGNRLTTFEVCFNRFVLAEVNTHRVFSRNSASSRAIPLLKQMAKVAEAPALPVVWASEQKGMQGGDALEDHAARRAEVAWLLARDGSLEAVAHLGEMKVHKSIANRLLEPFLMHTAVITATAYDNFFMLRLDPLAQPELRVAAEAMKAAYDASEPVGMGPGRWHLPYLREGEEAEIREAGYDPRHISSARCARVSYETHDGVRDWSKDVDLYTTLTTNGHASPLEHVATPAPWNVHEVEVVSMDKTVEQAAGGVNVTAPLIELTLPMYGNLLGWHQHRFDVEAARGYQSYA